ncbi:helix-turn-helix domain-containing protein, partial [Bowmanella yangjiangensis]
MSLGIKDIQWHQATNSLIVSHGPYLYQWYNNEVSPLFYAGQNRARLQYLLDGLQTGSDLKRIDELAFAAGFNSLSAFYTCFKRHTGLSPKAYLRSRLDDAAVPSAGSSEAR